MRNIGPLPEADKQQSRTRGPIPLFGPIVVKLHGSPLDEMTPDSQAAGSESYQHSLILSEHDYMRNIVSEIGAGPEWTQVPFSGMVNGERKHLWFLGYSMSDWNVRLRLYKQISQRKQGKVEGAPDKRNVDRFIDPLREPLMDVLDIHIERDDLSSFASTLANAPDVQRFMDSIHARICL